MFGISPEKLLVLLALGFVLLGPEKMPEMARQGAQMLRTLRDLAHGTRRQLTEELGPEFANFDLNSLNPKTAIRNAMLGGENDVSAHNPAEILQRVLRGEDHTGPAPSAASPPPTAAFGAVPFDPGAKS